MDTLNANMHTESDPESLRHTIDIYSLYCDLRTHFNQYGFFFKGSSLSFASDVMQHIDLADGAVDDNVITDTADVRNCGGRSGARHVTPAAEKQSSIDS